MGEFLVFGRDFNGQGLALGRDCGLAVSDRTPAVGHRLPRAPFRTQPSYSAGDNAFNQAVTRSRHAHAA